MVAVFLFFNTSIQFDLDVINGKHFGKHETYSNISNAPSRKLDYIPFIGGVFYTTLFTKNLPAIG
ncbi:hypothetical protein NBRC111893_580 [Lentilactobacillus kosonis]|uniref:Uncharacterized protein n=1 Tax=Lentilactobacillus kosonis TaxID=2810561 RepID=A0A401FJ81_9LACO|nr:hypothetical protein NBRC111893_580 [Lentilactobacillus kosonis]